MSAAAHALQAGPAFIAAGATLWTLFTVIGFVLLKSVKRWGKPWQQAVAVRAAACSFITAGCIGARGWIGDTTDTGIHVINQQGNAATTAVLGAGVMWIAWFVICGAWIAGIIPESWFDFDIPDWLSISGLILPALSAYMPASIGDFLGGMFAAIGSTLIGLFPGIGG